MGWQSILWGRRIIMKGARWRVGTGSSIYCKEDKWLPKASLSRAYPKIDHDPSICLVSHLIDHSAHAWDKRILEANFSHEDIQYILSLPVPYVHQEDKLIWHLTTKGGTLLSLVILLLVNFSIWIRLTGIQNWVLEMIWFLFFKEYEEYAYLESLPFFYG